MVIFILFSWNSFSEVEKQIIDQRLSTFLAQIIETRLLIIDQGLLRWHLDAQQISYPEHKSPFIWAYELIRAGASQIDDLEKYGLRQASESEEFSLLEIKRMIDEEFYILSRAHYERYFQLEAHEEPVGALEEA